MPVYTSSIEVTADYPTIKPSLNLNFARSRSLDPRITFTRASTATYIGRDGLVKYAGVDEPRFDHNSSTLESLGLLIEESRINHITNSQAPLSAAGSGNLSGGALTTSVITNVVSPDGTTSGVAQFNGDGTYRFGFANSGVAQQAYTGSIWVRAVSGTASFAIDVNDYNNLGYDAGLQTVGEEWRRFVVASQRPDTQPYRFMDFNVDNSNLYIWGPQLEDGAFPTSYIPTSGSAVTRERDAASITGANFSSWYNPYEVSVVGEYRSFAGYEGNRSPASYPSPFTIDNTATTRLVMTYHRYDGAISAFVRSSAGDTVADLDIYSSASSVSYGSIKYALASSNADGFSGIVNDGNIVTDTTVDMPTDVNRATIGGSYGSNTFSLNGTIKFLRYYPKRLTDAQLQQLIS